MHERYLREPLTPPSSPLVFFFSRRYTSLLPAGFAGVWGLHTQDDTGASTSANLAPATLSLAAGDLRTYAPPYSLQPSTSYFVQLTVIRTADGAAVSRNTTLVTAPCPSGGTVEVQPSSGIAGVTRCVRGAG